MKTRILAALALAGTLSACGIFKGGGPHKPKTAVLGDRIPILASEGDAKTDTALATVPVTVPAPQVNADWPQPGGNPQKSFGQPALAANLAVAWRAKIPGASTKARFAAAPVIADGRVYVIDTDAVVHAFSLQNGAPIWKTALNTGRKNREVLFGGGVSFDGGRVYATDGLGEAAALDAATGKLAWKVHPAGPLRGSPTVALGTVYVQTQDNQLYALKQDDGTTLWNQSATLQTAGVFGVAAPAVAQGTVVAGFSSGELSALRYENGRVVWQDQLSRTSISTAVASISDVDASPVIDGGKVYAIGQGGRMVAMDLVSGQRLWELTIAGIDTPWLAGDWIFVVTDEAKVLCIARATGKVRWTAELPRWYNPKSKNRSVEWSGPVLAGGRLLLTSTRGELATVNVADGKILSDQKKTGKSFFLAPVVANNTMLTLDVNGTITAWR